MSDIKVKDVKEVQTLRIAFEGEDLPEATFYFNPDDVKSATVSFDGGKSEVPVNLVAEAISAFSSRHPDFAV